MRNSQAFRKVIDVSTVSLGEHLKHMHGQHRGVPEVTQRLLKFRRTNPKTP